MNTSVHLDHTSCTHLIYDIGHGRCELIPPPTPPHPPPRNKIKEAAGGRNLAVTFMVFCTSSTVNRH